MAVVNDDFNRGDEELGTSADWTEDNGDWEIVSNRAEILTVGAYHKARWSGAALASNDNYSEVDVYTSTIDADSGGGSGVRQTADANVSGYTTILFGQDSFYLIDVTGGAENILGSWGTVAQNTLYVMRTEADGTTIRMFVDGTQRVSTSDASYASGPPGMFSFGSISSVKGAYFNDWEAGDLAVRRVFSTRF